LPPGWNSALEGPNWVDSVEKVGRPFGFYAFGRFGAAVLCTHTFDTGRLMKVVGGSGQRIDPTPKPSAADKEDDDDDDVDKLANEPMPKPPGVNKDDVDMEGLANDPAKMREYIRKQLPPDAQRMFDQTNKP
jgi:hypothetical protein